MVHSTHGRLGSVTPSFRLDEKAELIYIKTMSIAEIEEAIKSLPKDKLAEFDQWYHDFLDDQWDEQIAADARAGKLDFLLEEVREAEADGTLRPFP